MDTFLQDLRYAFRAFRAAPVVTLVTALTIAIGTGATTTILSVANAVLFRPPPGVRDGGRLVSVHARSRDGSSFHAFSWLDAGDLAAAPGGPAGLAAYSIFPASLGTGGAPELRLGMLVSGNYFRTLGTRPGLGRFFLPEETRAPGGPRVAVLSEGEWRRRFGADSGIVGRAVLLNGQPYTVVGVAEPGFHGHIGVANVGVWVPVVADPRGDVRAALQNRSRNDLELVGRLGPGVTREGARAALSLTYARTGRAAGLDWDREVDVLRSSGVPAQILMPVTGFLGLLLGLAAIVLLIASANVANLLLARAQARGREIAVRLAVGASRARLIRQLVTESVALYLLGGGAGTLFAIWCTGALRGFTPPIPIPTLLDFHLDVRVLAVALLVTLVAGLGFGLAPALQATRPDLVRALKDEPSVARVGRFRLRGAFVAAQVAGTALLLVTAGLFVRGLARAGSIDLGFSPRSVYAVNLQMAVSSRSDAETRAFAAALEARAALLPGVARAAIADHVPLNMSRSETGFTVEGREARPGVGVFQTDFSRVSPSYFDAMGLRLTGGRSFSPEDREGSPRVAIVNETLARRTWPGDNPVGKRINFGGVDEPANTTIVGVVRDAKYNSLSEAPTPMVYVPFAQWGGEQVTLIARMEASSAGSGGRARPADPGRALAAAVSEVDPALPVAQSAWLDDLIGVALLPNRAALAVAALFGATGLVLAMVGLYGVLSFMVARRRREIGIRMALGAAGSDVRNLVVGGGTKLVAVGLAAGFGTAALVSRLLRSFLFGLSPLDPVTYGAIAFLYGSVALAACLVPARRAVRTDPLEVLRHD